LGWTQENVINEASLKLPEIEVQDSFQLKAAKRIRSESYILINPQTNADMLEHGGEVFVQRSQLGGGSPVIRGFEANRIILVLDGIRMNNSIYRGGHLQNIITLDPFMLEQTEILSGSNSLLFGTDALGGAISMYTRKVKLDTFQVGAALRYSSAAHERTVHVNVNKGWKRFGCLTSLSFTGLSDLRAGNIRSPMFPDFGRKLQYFIRKDGKDSLVNNADPNVQKFSGYNLFHAIQKLYWQGDKTIHTLNLQWSQTSNIPRYDRLRDLEWAEWYYGPMIRGLAAYNGKRQLGKKQLLEVSLAYQFIEESRYTRRPNRPNTTANIENVHIINAIAQYYKNLRQIQYRLGVEYFFNDVQSRSKFGPVRFPQSTVHNASTFANASYKPFSWLLVNGGIRYQYQNIQAYFANYKTENLSPQFSQSVGALAGSLEALFRLPKRWEALGVFSTGYRAPNIEDFGKTFEWRAGQVVLPNPNLKPEKTLQYEAGVRKQTSELEFSFFVYFTRYLDIIDLGNMQYKGQDSIIFNQTLSRVKGNINKGQGHIMGYEGKIRWQASSAIGFSQNLTYTYGWNTELQTPLSHIPPLFGKTEIELKYRKAKILFYALYQGWKPVHLYGPDGEDNLEDATPLGAPSWITFNLKAVYPLQKYITASLGLENIGDAHYRQFASGISAPGRNLILAFYFKL
jgi:hemoglobin/transferrin/lactoferrin receptor protein